jgi:hypothetical protein
MLTLRRAGKLDAPPTVASLSAVAQYLSDMMTQLDDGAVSDPDDEALFRANDGHGHRVIVEQMQDGDGDGDGDGDAIPSGHRWTRVNAQTALSREDAIALCEALESL